MKKPVIKTLLILLGIGLFILGFKLIYDFPYLNSRALYDAIEAEDIATVRELLEQGVDPNGLTGRPNKIAARLEINMVRRPMSAAAFTGNLELVTLLIDYGATAENNPEVDWNPLTAVFLFYDDTDLEMAKLLLANGASPYESFPESSFSLSPLEQAASYRVYENGVYNEAAAQMSVALIELLMDGNSVQPLTENGRSLLSLAVLEGNSELVRYLLQKGADPTLEDRFDRDTYDYAAGSLYAEQMLALLPEREDTGSYPQQQK